MDLQLDGRPGRVVAAEILWRYNSPVSFDPSYSACEYFLVLSVGRCKFRLDESSVAAILHAVIGGQLNAFRIVQLGDWEFRFFVHSQEVGFHIYRLRSFECSSFKIFFHLWHRGGLNFRAEYNLWLHEQSSEWIEVGKKNYNSNPLSGANLVCQGNSHVHRDLSFQIQKSDNHERQSAFKHIQWPSILSSNALNSAFKGILGPYPKSGYRAFDPIHGQASKTTCQSCGQFGHHSGRCRLSPRSSRPQFQPGDNFASRLSQTSGPRGFKAINFASFSDFSKHILCLSPPPLRIVPGASPRKSRRRSSTTSSRL